VTEEDIRVLLDGYEAWNRREPEALADVLDPEMEWEPGFGDLNAGRHHGADGFRGFVDSWIESFDDFNIRPHLLVQAGDVVVVHAHQTGRGRGSGIELESHVVHVWTLRDGKALRWWGPRTLGDALEALGDDKPALVLRGYENFNDGKLDEALSLFNPDVVWGTWIVPGPGGATYRGHEGVRELWSEARNVFGDFRNVPERIIGVGERVVAFVTVQGRGRGSGAEVEGRIAHVYDFKGDKVSRVESYEDRDEALAAVGIDLSA
jgi:ketosteroid isomerase-like protein